MSTITSPKYDYLIKTVREWPVAERLAIVHDILSSVAAELPKEELSEPELTHSDNLPRNTLVQALGMLSSGSTAPPDDEQVESWLDERRLQKYAS
jgi:hypothetical protein